MKFSTSIIGDDKKKKRKIGTERGFLFCRSLVAQGERERDGREEEIVDCDGGGICAFEEHPWGIPIQVVYGKM